MKRPLALIVLLVFATYGAFHALLKLQTLTNLGVCVVTHYGTEWTCHIAEYGRVGISSRSVETPGLELRGQDL